jgi:hypothetical protein
VPAQFAFSAYPSQAFGNSKSGNACANDDCAHIPDPFRLTLCDTNVFPAKTEERHSQCLLKFHAKEVCGAAFREFIDIETVANRLSSAGI